MQIFLKYKFCISYGDNTPLPPKDSPNPFWFIYYTCTMYIEAICLLLNCSITVSSLLKQIFKKGIITYTDKNYN